MDRERKREGVKRTVDTTLDETRAADYSVGIPNYIM